MRIEQQITAGIQIHVFWIEISGNGENRGKICIGKSKALVILNSSVNGETVVIWFLLYWDTS